ncbi:nucleolar rna m c nop2p [Phaffia rhodozyma]|uniref:Nucleolar protein 2 n=1 Tax=Phaffia rhodozyma TaxID=264483 RepID=A0A0F7SMA3_PHARH|nr:nucleolar rna m c nop2p [Phaffia rhodozyma]
MGRLAKNKQGPPQTLETPAASSGPQGSKRKADGYVPRSGGKKVRLDAKGRKIKNPKKPVESSVSGSAKKTKGKKKSEADDMEDEATMLDGFSDDEEIGEEFQLAGGNDDEGMPRPAPRELQFSDSEAESDDFSDDEAGQLPPGADNQFNLDEGDFPSDSDEDGEFLSGEEDTSGAETSEDEEPAAKSSKVPQVDSDGDEIQTNILGEDGEPIDGEDVEDDDSFDGEEKFELPSVEERETEKTKGVGEGGLRKVERRLGELIRILSDWSKFGGKDGKSRSEYWEQLITDIATYYGYNEFLAEKLLQLFPLSEAIAFFDANETPRPVTIRTNTLRTRRRDLAQALISRGVNLEPIGKWTKVGLQVFESAVPIGATPEYLGGHYMLQAASSFLPVMALAPQPNERVLDMASAPGGKTTYISALLQNTGLVFANDSNKARTKSLTANIHRLGCKNVVVCNYDGREFPKVMGGFDRVLLDAPCSGTGVIAKDASVKVNKSERDFHLLSHLQKQLILCAIDSINPDSPTGGYLVYSTCSVTVDENESVVEYALRKRPNVKLVDTGLEFGREGFANYKGRVFGDRMKLTRRYWPHVHNVDGFYVAKFKVSRLSKKARLAQESEAEPADEVDEPFVPLPISVEEEEKALEEAEKVKKEGESVKFDDEEDKKIIEHSTRKHLKKTKGIKLTPKTSTSGPAKTA